MSSKNKVSFFEGDTLEELVNYIKELYRKEDLSELYTYWYIGKNINIFIKKHGEGEPNTEKKIASRDGWKFNEKNTVGRIADKVVIQEDTLEKFREFARKYKKKDIKSLTSKFKVSWWLLSKCLKYEPDKIKDEYNYAENEGEFYNNIKSMFEKSEPKSIDFLETTIHLLKEELEKKNESITILKGELDRLKGMITHGIDSKKILRLLGETQKGSEKVPGAINSERELVAYLKKLYRATESTAINIYWQIGKNILTFYEGKYGDKYRDIACKSRLNGRLHRYSPKWKILLSEFLRSYASIASNGEEDSAFNNKKDRRILASKSNIGKYGELRKYHTFVLELRRIADKIDMDRAFLAKCCQFALEYTKEDLDIFSTGKFTLSWELISKNLDIALIRDLHTKNMELTEIFQNALTKQSYIKAISKWQKNIDPTYYDTEKKNEAFGFDEDTIDDTITNEPKEFDFDDF